MRKKFLLIIPIIIIIFIVIFVWFTLSPDAVRAQLIIESGSVQVKHSGEPWISAQNGMLLHQSDYIKTGNNTSASIILFESSIIRLDSNTEVALQEIFDQEGKSSVTIDQNAGRTWNTVRKISGIDDYEVQTPTTVASVRGTAFVVIVEPNGTTYYGVSHGTLNVSSISNGVIQDTIDLKKHVATLETKYQIVLKALFFEGMTQQEASDELEIPLGTIKSRLKIGLRELKKIYDPQ